MATTLWMSSEEHGHWRRRSQRDEGAAAHVGGTGAVTYNAVASPAPPIVVRSLDARTATTIRFYLNVPATVSRFSITETVQLQNVLGVNSASSTAQSVFH